MDGQILRYFAGGNTAKGFYSLFDSNIKGLERVFILSGKSKAEKSQMISELADEWTGKGFSLEVLHSADNTADLDGLIIRELGFGIVDGDAPREISKEYMGSHWETIDLETAWPTAKLEDQLPKIKFLQEKLSEAKSQAYHSYAAGLRVHDEWEHIYIERMDFNKANEVTRKLLEKLFTHKKESKDCTVVHRFLGAATPVGPVDFVDNITTGLTKRFFLKGRAGTGKSTLLKKIVAEGESRGFDLEIYHCGFDPGSLDMVIVRELGWAVFDSTLPHEYFPNKNGDEIIDMYELTVSPGTDEMFANEIAEIESRYREKMSDGKRYLAEAKQIQDQLEFIYKDACEKTFLKELIEEINVEIQLLALNH
ncbi:PRK06851 family protein [Lederbergia citrea]|uniref:PRK06851 family protein n=1 Tax=Lederbergia citrea TaxID=2833581 RepID=A0A942URA8_9BACI|nr:PRK06851 family protein [Lederbergia citrea]MBS4223518.1 PRK06851 family protein [Lederbergia citrea]